ncbi:MAG: TonB-dependent receptor [Myxococcota bacterium]|nr:TonB-dependent receptor [Myxococcota bacterium]
MRRYPLLLLLPILVLPGAGAYASEPVDQLGDIEELSLDDLLNVETSVSTRVKAKTIRDAPGIVTVMTREQIQRSGARGLQDLLEQVPGFQLGADVWGQGYFSLRGLWGGEGKILVLLDGHELSEQAFLTSPFSNRVSLDWIERIEVVRGPGSVVYGGAAGLAVVNIVTRQAEVLRGISTEIEYSQMTEGVAADDVDFLDSIGRANLSASYGQVFDTESETSLAVHAFGGTGQRSDRYYDAYDERIRLAGDALHAPLAVLLDAAHQGFKVSHFLENYRGSQRDHYDLILEKPLSVSYLSSSLRASYSKEILPELELEPSVSYLYQSPWNTDDSTYGYEANIHRVDAKLLSRWTPIEELSLILGADYSFLYGDENSYAPEEEGGRLYTDDQHHGIAAYLEGLLSTDWVNVSAGARIDWHSQFGAALSPRISLARRFDAFHLKGLFSQAFKAPSISNLRLNEQLESETISAWELELGYDFHNTIYLVANAFYMSIDDMIVYSWDELTELESYDNLKGMQTTGFEVEARAVVSDFSASLAYSFYYPLDVEVDYFKTPGKDASLLGFSPHKLSAGVSFGVTEDVTVSSNAQLLGLRYGVDYASGEAELLEFQPEVLLDAKIAWADVLLPGLRLAVSAHNLLGAKRWWIQPYDGGHPALPGASTEVMLELGYAAKLD